MMISTQGSVANQTDKFKIISINEFHNINSTQI